MASSRRYNIKAAFKMSQPKLLCLANTNQDIHNEGLKATEINKIRISPKETSESDHSNMKDLVVATSDIADNSVSPDCSSMLFNERYCTEKTNKLPFSSVQNVEPVIKAKFDAVPPIKTEMGMKLKPHGHTESSCGNVMDHSQKYLESEPETLSTCSIADEDSFQGTAERKCLSILKLARKYLKEDPQNHVHDRDDLSVILKTFTDAALDQDYMLCFSILLCAVTTFSPKLENKKAIESHLIKLLQASKSKKKFDGVPSSNEIGGHEIQLLPEAVRNEAVEICKEMKICDWELNSIDVCFVACTSVKNLFTRPSGLSKQCGCNPDVLHCVVDKIHEAVQLLSLTKPICFSESGNDYHLNLRVICQCLQVLEQASFMNPDNKKCILSYQNFIVSRHSNRLLGFCLKSLFYNDSLSHLPQLPNPESKPAEINKLQFYLKLCLVCVLKVLLNITHDCKEAVIKLGTIEGLIEKLLMCTLNVCSRTSEEQFEVLILCLELIINLIEPSWSNRKVFAVLCLKKFDGSDDKDAMAVELLIKILVERLNEIKLLEKLNDEAAKEVELRSENDPKGKDANKSPDDVKANIVFQAAGKHMEQSMICTYISILLGFFVDMKKTFRELVQKQMTEEVVNQAVLVSKGFLSFIELTEGMSKKGIKSLTTMLATLQAIHVDR